MYPTLPAGPGFLGRTHWILPHTGSVSAVLLSGQGPDLFWQHQRGWARWNCAVTWPREAVTLASFPDKTKNVLDLRKLRKISSVFCWCVFKCNILETQRWFAQCRSKRWIVSNTRNFSRGARCGTQPPSFHVFLLGVWCLCK